ncbi:Aste57867_11225 [Aphanomyces stellatus]|uniref:Aste57867_11225 protein n=1 Tax=Aphanomyces stellatus TaxID=120398 RepID=A0A485KST0_9STRA|nr:hypothetical protein As57867_011183 [Aphanomyces stellatus]VFT88091.1 Aste57867_11225 [Aphanomyces stellatus]
MAVTTDTSSSTHPSDDIKTCPFATSKAPIDLPCSYATMASKNWRKVSTSATLAEYATYLGGLPRSPYAAYIRLLELEKTWGLWSLRAATPMPADPFPSLLQPAASTTTTMPPAPLYRLAPAMSSIEITLRMALDFLDVNLPALHDPSSAPFRTHRPYVQHQTRMDALLRNLTAQASMLRMLIDLDDVGDDAAAAYLLTSTTSLETLGQSQAWYWQHTHPSLSPKSFLARVSAQIHAQFADLPFGLGVFCDSHSLHLPYDAVVAPAFIRTHACQSEAEFAEDHFFTTVHQICEAWCCVMERQLDAAQDDIDALSLVFDAVETPRRLQRIARRYRFCSIVWEFLIDHTTMLTEMDMCDYHSLRVLLHGASGGQSVRMRQLKRRISHLLPLIPAALEVSVQPTYAAVDGFFNPADWLDLMQLLAHVRSSEKDEANDALVAHIQQLFAHQASPACHVTGVVQAVQTLENNVRRFYFGHQYMAIMVLGGGTRGTEDFTMKMLERTWKDPKRYLSCEQAKTQLSDAMEAMVIENDNDAKGKLVQKLVKASKARHASHKAKAAGCPHATAAVLSPTSA